MWISRLLIEECRASYCFVVEMHARNQRNRRKTFHPQIFLDEYQAAARRTDQNAAKGLDGLAFPLLGLFGEVGTLLSALKKKLRDRDSYVGYSDAVVEEFGDVLWYFSNIASRASLNLSVLGQLVSRDLNDWADVEVEHVAAFRELQPPRVKRASPNSPEFESALIALAGTGRTASQRLQPRESRKEPRRAFGSFG
jgi:NTP pyrophosphatase (non-canonical NTP hydrolase)